MAATDLAYKSHDGARFRNPLASAPSKVEDNMSSQRCPKEKIDRCVEGS